MKRFSNGFLLGAATAAHQVEGNNVLSDAWAQEHMKTTHDTFIATAKIEVLQPDQVALFLHPVDDGLAVGDAGKNGRNEAGGADDFDILHPEQTRCRNALLWCETERRRHRTGGIRIIAERCFPLGL